MVVVLIASFLVLLLFLLFWLYKTRETLCPSAPWKISNKVLSGDHVIVIGAGMTGLLVAAVCAKTFRHVTILESDKGDMSVYARAGTPQAPHIHILSGVFLALAESFLPGFREKLLSSGSVVHNFGSKNVHIQTGVSVMSQAAEECISRISCSRSLVEGTFRNLLLESCKNIKMMSAVARDYKFNDTGRVIGVQIADGQSVQASLVIDCSGNHSNHKSRRASIESSLRHIMEYSPNITYCSTLIDYEKPLKYSWFTVLHDAPTQTKSATLVRQESVDKCTYLLSIRNNGEAPPTEREDIISFCASLNLELRDLLELGDWNTKVSKYNVQKSFKYTYSRLPIGLLIFGDALCVTNPAYGKGMTISAKSAKILSNSLERSKSYEELSFQVERSLNPMLDSEYSNGMLNDFLFDEIEPFMKRPFFQLAQVAYAARLRRLSSSKSVFGILKTIIVGSNTNPFRIYHPILIFHFILDLFYSMNKPYKNFLPI